jgi:hypothetical protein
MKTTKEFDFSRARRVTAREVEEGRRAIEAKWGVKRPSRGRPPKSAAEKYCPVHIRLHPRAYHWAHREARRRHVGYQTVINQALLGLTGTSVA